MFDHNVTFARIARRVHGQPTSHGAGVKLRRVIGTSQLPDLDPFLMLDEFGTDRAEDYIAGFPEHPHRGFETVTYMLDGRMRHRDNKGNEGVLVPGSVQWMTAGRGLVHSEMPEQQEGRMRGFQLWVNLPAAQKMSEPRYQEFAPERIPVAHPANGVAVKIIAGEVVDADGNAVRGPIVPPATEPLYLDLDLQPGAAWVFDLPAGHNAFLYAYEAKCRSARARMRAASKRMRWRCWVAASGCRCVLAWKGFGRFWSPADRWANRSRATGRS